MSTLTFECDLLSSFALCVDFPHALVERDFHDYFDDSVTIPLARVRSILRSSKRLSLKAHYYGRSVAISLSADRRSRSLSTVQSLHTQAPHSLDSLPIAGSLRRPLPACKLPSDWTPQQVV
jgi:hypothetical protein